MKYTVALYILVISLNSFSQSEVNVGKFLEAGTKNPVELKLKTSSPKEKYEYRPEALRNGRWSRMLSGGKEFSINFGYDTAAFYSASFLSLLVQLATHPEKDVLMLSNFVAHQILDPASNIGFLTFGITSAASNQYMKSLGVRHGWLRDQKKYTEILKELERRAPLPKELWADRQNYIKTGQVSNNLKPYWEKIRNEAESLIPKPKSQELFGKLQHVSGFSLAFFTSTLVTDILHDKDISFYSKYLVSSPDEINKLIAEYGYSPAKALDQAYDRWVIQGKIIDYLPRLASSLMALTTQSFILPSVVKKSANTITKLGERYAPVILNGIKFAGKIGSYLPQGRMAVTIGNVFIFLQLDHLFAPFIEEPFHSWRYGRHIKHYINELDKPIRPTLTNSCVKLLEKKFPKETIAQTSYSVLKTYLNNVNDPSCQDMELSFKEKFNVLNLEIDDWQKYWFQNSMGALLSWQEYINNIQNNYMTAFRFYQNFIKEVNTTDNVSFMSYPFYGLDENSDKSKVSEKLAKAYLFVKNKLSKMSGTTNKMTIEYRHFYKMYTYFSALDFTTTPNAELLLLIQNFKTKAKNPEEEKSLEVAAREEYFGRGIFYLEKMLKETNVYSSQKPGRDFHGFMDLKEILKGGSPLEDGMLLMELANTDDDYADTKDNKSMNKSIKYRLAKTRAEYYMLSIACGPNYNKDGKQDGFFNFQKTVNELPYWGVSFMPPRLTINQSNICDEIPAHAVKTKQNYSLDEGDFEYHRKTYENIVIFAKDNIRPEFIGVNAVANLNQFWINTVNSEVYKLVDKKMSDFKKLISEQVMPNYFSEEKYEFIPKGTHRLLQWQFNYYLRIMGKLGHVKNTDVEAIAKLNEIYSKDILEYSRSPKESAVNLLIAQSNLNKKIIDIAMTNKNTLTADESESLLEVISCLEKVLEMQIQIAGFVKIFTAENLL